MKFKNKRRLRILKHYWVGWILATLFLSIVRGVGTTETGHVEVDFPENLLYSLIFGPFFGTISGIGQILVIERTHKGISFQKMLLLRLFYAVLFLSVITIFSYIVMGKLILELDVGLFEFAFDEGSPAIYFYLIFVDISFTIISQVSMMLGEGKLRKLLLGKFYNPRDEERIFMFLDLKSSTQLAEKLGHIRYSRFIQDCFNDLGIVAESEAEIYQYVGDEAILTWKLKNGIRNQNCLKAFFDFKAQLASRKDHYLKEYSWEPEFKAGLNSGIVTVTEVGKYKKEIAYHGDTINTAARIQAQCGELKQELLISEDLKTQIDSDDFKFSQLGSIELKGKEIGVNLFAVSMGYKNMISV